MKFVSKILMCALLLVHLINASETYNNLWWNKQKEKWFAWVKKDGRQIVGKTGFQNELDAAKEVDRLCDKLRLRRKNFEKDGTRIPKRIIERTSRYRNVFFDKRKHRAKLWVACVFKQGKNYKQHCKSELDAAHYVDIMCDKFNIPRRNFDEDGIEIQKSSKFIQQNQLQFDAVKKEEDMTLNKRKRGKKSKIDIFKKYKPHYKCIFWNKRSKRWIPHINLLYGRRVYGSYQENEEDAAKVVDTLCDEYGLARKNFNKDGTRIHTQVNEEVTTVIPDEISVSVADHCLRFFDGAKKHETEELQLLENNSQPTIILAAKRGYSHIVKFLISKGVNKMQFTDDGHTPLSLAVLGNHLEVVKILFEQWMYPNYITDANQMHLSPIYNVKSWEMVQFLVEQDTITHNIVNENNQTPLTIACQNGLLEVVQFFILNDGLEINHIDKFNKTPLYYAHQNNHQDVVEFLKQNGANYGTCEDYF